MKKIGLIFLSALVCFSLVACGEKSAMQEATGASSKQVQQIDTAIQNAGISYEMVNEANHNRPDVSLPENSKVYNLLDKNGNNYFLVLDDNFAVISILNADGTTLN